MRRGGMLNLGLQNDKAVKNGVNDRMTNEGWTTGWLMRAGMISTASLSQAWTDGLNLVATRPNHFLAHHHLINRPFGPGLDHMAWIPAGQFFLDWKPRRVGALIVAEKKHTKDTCFQLHMYLEWWYELRGKNNEWNGYATFVTNIYPNTLVSLDSQPQFTTQDPCIIGSTNLVSNGEHVNNWIIDSGATYHMTYDHNDFKTKSVPRWKAISNANGDIYPVTEGGTPVL
jgi:hypothetical protein